MSRAGTNDLVLGGEPRVDLMPAEVHAKRQGGSTRRLLTLVLIASIVIVGAGYAAASLKAVSSTAELAVSQARTQELLAEQATYSEVTHVIQGSALITEARPQVTATEVLWKDYLDPVLAALPPTATVVSIAAVGRSPIEPELGITGPLREPRVAGLTITIKTPTIPDATGWMRRLPNTPAFADSMPTSIANPDGTYTTTITLNASDDALSHRFDDEEEPTEDGADG